MIQIAKLVISQVRLPVTSPSRCVVITTWKESKTSWMPLTSRMTSNNNKIKAQTNYESILLRLRVVLSFLTLVKYRCTNSIAGRKIEITLENWEDDNDVISNGYLMSVEQLKCSWKGVLFFSFFNCGLLSRNRKNVSKSKGKFACEEKYCTSKNVRH